MKSQKKLSLNKETVAKLNDEQMNQVKGGGTGAFLIGTAFIVIGGVAAHMGIAIGRK